MKLLATWIVGLGVGAAVVATSVPALLEEASQHPGREMAIPVFVGTEAERARMRQLDAALVHTRHAVEAKTALAEAVARGDLALVDAARRFRELDGGPDLVRTAFRHYYPHASDAELHCRNVIGFVKSQFIDESAEQERQARRLEQDLLRHLRAGTLRVDD